MRFVGAVSVFFLVLINLVILLAITESVTGKFLTLGGSRNALALVGVAIAGGLSAWWFVHKKRADAAKAAAAPEPNSAQAGLDRLKTSKGRAAAERKAALQADPAQAALEKLMAMAAQPGTTLPDETPAAAPVSSLKSDPAQAALEKLMAMAAQPTARGALDPALVAASRQAILFRQDFPPDPDAAPLSFFGGAPFLDGPLEWPTGPNGKPLHFLMQIDCAAIPRAAGLGMPDDGILYFFLDLTWGEGFGWRVFHRPPFRGEWADAAPPAALSPLFGDQAAHVWPGALSAADVPVLFPKWPFQPVVIAIGEDAYAENREAPTDPYIWGGDANLGDAIEAAQGGAVSSSPWTVRDFNAPEGEPLARPFPGFPQDWRALCITAAHIAKEAARAERHPRASLFPELEGEAKLARLTALRNEAEAWFTEAAAKDADAAPGGGVSDTFWTWLSDNRSLTLFALPTSVTEAVEASLIGASLAAARVPKEAVMRIAARHALCVKTETGRHINTPDRMLAAPSNVQGNQWERAQTDLLLLELSSNDGLGHHFAEGVYQFWITPEDLAAGRFEKVVVTADAY